MPAPADTVWQGGTGLPEAWAGQPAFAIGETGFGAGLTFLSVWDLWRRDPRRPRFLHHVSVEGFPQTRAQMRRALGTWPAFGALAERLATVWPEPSPGFHRLRFEGGAVTLTLLVGPVAPMLAELEAEMDAWILDGSAPSNSPETWSPAVFADVARLSRPGARLAAFAATGRVRHALQDAGFRMERAPGFEHRSNMLQGVFAGPRPPSAVEPWYRPPAPLVPGTALVVGGGIAGAAMASALHDRGWRVRLAERHLGLAAEGSGNPAGIVMPRLVLGSGPERHFHAQAFRHALDRLAPWLEATGVLELAGGAEAAARQEAACGAGVLAPELMRHVDAAQAARHARVALAGAAAHGALWFERAGWLAPQAACRGLAEGARIELGADIGVPGGGEADLVILAGGLDTRRFAAAAWLPLVPRRGQVTAAPATPAGAALACVLGGEGYVIPAGGGRHVVGATFDPVKDSVPARPQEARPEDDRRNLAAAEAWIPGLVDPDPRHAVGRAALRAMTPDHLPLAGPLPDHGDWLDAYAGLRTGDRRRIPAEPPLHARTWVLSGLGARGLTTAPLAAELIAAQVSGEPWPVPRSVAAALHPGRFLIRGLRTRRL
ncbi:FAD-dependent 5-carboxymethylaminomethyl-2-thiouridine(34) oxidoreductase MnmC [Arenibaculum sp.]|uniref:FAD-dependent 5-carboxymethylaminomethyl-2-thiouridine(34) oxidoreductase MnmC n=1 Tax=Arenibaculum sp. TaxID=2865862 RepID=UPI002E11D890|nr:FAD-dependent 5-carboxymethylaminomethyl-2-thiouridine(34) oxidoreductase MnmC [Arenibaculum sp.]